MRIVYIAAGAAGSYCGACTHDTALARGLAAAGHDVEFIALYTPVHIDREDFSHCPVFYGGINAYLQQHSEFFRRTPEFLDRVLDSAWLLGMISRFAVNTRPEDLGDMAVSVLAGSAGRQRKELHRLVRYLAKRPRPDVIHITNSLLSGLAPTLHSRLAAPVVCNLQGEEAFVDRLGDPYRDQATKLMRDNAKSVAAFIAPYAAYGREMAEYLAVEAERMTIVPPGIDPAPYTESAPSKENRFRIGYLGRLSPVKGLDMLCRAFAALARDGKGNEVLAVAGQTMGQSGQFWKERQAELASAGLAGRVEFIDSPDLASKAEFLRRCSVFALPSRVPERLAITCLEAMAAGVPVVAPDSGIFPKFIERTGGGVLIPPEDVDALTRTLRKLRDDPKRRESLGAKARLGMLKHFSAKVMTDATLDLYRRVMASGTQ